MNSIRLPRVMQKTGYGRSSILQKVREGSFPTPFKLGPHAVAWLEVEVDSWIAARVAERDAGTALVVTGPRRRGRPQKLVEAAEPAPVETAPRRRRRASA